MAGLGTGLAPFRAFVEYRAWQKAQGIEIGPILLYMGARHRREEYLYGEEWEAYETAGIVTLLSCAFSRDQPEKIYIQDRMRQTLDEIIQAYTKEDGAFYLCGPTWPVPDVTDVLQEAIVEGGRREGKKVDGAKKIDELKDKGRYVLEGMLTPVTPQFCDTNAAVQFIKYPFGSRCGLLCSFFLLLCIILYNFRSCKIIAYV